MGLLLAGDIGGTKTDLALFSAERGPRAPLARAQYPSQNYDGLASIVRAFLAENPTQLSGACFDVAGPVFAGRAHITNLPWLVDAAELASEFGIPRVGLINDLEALALSIPLLEPADLHTLWPGEPVHGGTIAVIAPGTGLGQAFLTWDGEHPRAHASEGGHSDFAPASALQSALLEYLRREEGHVSVERICSGIGVPNIYDYLRDSSYAAESHALAAQLAATEDRTPLIFDAARRDPPDRLCRAALDIFVEVLGAESSNLALKVLSTGGIYIGGGIPPRIIDELEHDRFRNALLDKGRMSELVARMPVHIILEQAALFGAASLGLETMTA